MEERLQKILARAGLGSRRSCETIISAGRVTVNGQTAQLGSKADPNQDTIMVDGKSLSKSQSRIYIALYKPRGVLSTVDAPDPRPTVRNLVPVSEMVYPVGRLDIDSEGLILLTNDGELTDKLTHPRYEHEKEYRVLVASTPDSKQLEAWRHGVVLADGHKSAPTQVTLESSAGKGAWLRIIMTEGRKRQIRETGSLIGLPVVRIIRTRIGTLLLGRLKPSEWRYLSNQEVEQLRIYTKLEKPVQKPIVKQKDKPFRKYPDSAGTKDSKNHKRKSSNARNYSSAKKRR